MAPAPIRRLRRVITAPPAAPPWSVGADGAVEDPGFRAEGLTALFAFGCRAPDVENPPCTVEGACDRRADEYDERDVLERAWARALPGMFCFAVWLARILLKLASRGC